MPIHKNKVIENSSMFLVTGINIACGITKMIPNKKNLKTKKCQEKWDIWVLHSNGIEPTAL